MGFKHFFLNFVSFSLLFCEVKFLFSNCFYMAGIPSLLVGQLNKTAAVREAILSHLREDTPDTGCDGSVRSSSGGTSLCMHNYP